MNVNDIYKAAQIANVISGDDTGYITSGGKNTGYAGIGTKSTSGFFNTAGGEFVAAMLGPLADSAVQREQTSNENMLSRMHDVEMANIAQQNALAQMRRSQEFSLGADSTKYQRQIADMVAAGLNPGTIAGSAIAGGNVSGSNIVGTASGRSGVLGYSNGGNPLGSMMSSAFNAVIAKDKNAAEIAKQEMVDNAKHFHHLEELDEKKAIAAARIEKLNAERDYFKASKAYLEK